MRYAEGEKLFKLYIKMMKKMWFTYIKHEKYGLKGKFENL